jgi:hypothetical protein
MRLFDDVLLGLVLSMPLVIATVRGELLPVLKVESVFPLKISVVEGGRKEELYLIEDLNLLIGAEYSDAAGQDLNGDGVDELVVVLTAGTDTPNSCALVFFYDREMKDLSQIKFEGGPICNHKQQGGYVVSSFKDAGAWGEQIYKVVGGESKLMYFDWCVSCDETRRVDYSTGVPISYLVSSDLDFERRVPLEYVVTSSKAAVYEGLNDQSPTRRYLLNSDAVRVLSVKQSFAGDWRAEIRFAGRVVTDGWVLCSDLGDCTVAQ